MKQLSDSAIDEYGIGRYDVEVESFDIEPVVDDGIIEQNEVIAVKVYWFMIFDLSLFLS